MVWETWVQSQVASYQGFLKWYSVPPCLTLSNIRYVSRVKWSNPKKRVAPSPPLRCSSYWKGSLLVAFNYGRQLTFTKILSTDFKKVYNFFLFALFYLFKPHQLLMGYLMPKFYSFLKCYSLKRWQHHFVCVCVCVCVCAYHVRYICTGICGDFRKLGGW